MRPDNGKHLVQNLSYLKKDTATKGLLHGAVFGGIRGGVAAQCRRLPV